MNTLNDVNIINLNNSKRNILYIIHELDNTLSFYEQERLMSYGFVKGNKILVVRKSLFKNTLQIYVKNSNIIIRKKDANRIFIKIAS